MCVYMCVCVCVRAYVCVCVCVSFSLSRIDNDFMKSNFISKERMII